MCRQLGNCAILFAFLACVSSAAAETVESIPRPERFVVDTTGSVEPAMLEVIDDLAEFIPKISSNCGMVAVVISTTGGANHLQFARQLFDQWEVINSRPFKGNFGILVVLDDREIEIVFDEGFDDAERQIEIDRLVNQHMTGYFEQGKTGLAILSGARAVCHEIYHFDPSVNMLLEAAGEEKPSVASPGVCPF
jgi:uncharacterized membrane protein YgcG